MPVVLLCRDLMTSSQAAGAAMRAHVALETVSTAEAFVARCASGGVPLAFIDLTVPGIELVELVASLHGLANPPGRIVGFGPHVQAERLAAARAAGCDEVLSRGQFHAQCEALMVDYALE